MNTAETPSERPPAGSEDPVASLFSADRTLPAPVVAPEVNESELTRWKSARDSLFGELVKDPPPSERSVSSSPPSRTGRTVGTDHDEEPLTEARRPAPVAAKPPPAAVQPRDEGRTSDSGTPLVRALSVTKIGHQHEAGRDPARIAMSRAEEAAELAPPTGLPKLESPQASKKKTKLNAAPPPPAAGARVDQPAPPQAPRLEPGAKRARPESPPNAAGRTRKKTPPTRPEVADAAAQTRAGRPFRRGPKPLLLAALALLVLAAGGVSAVVLEIVPDPFAEPRPPMVRGTSVRGTSVRGTSTPATKAEPVAAAPVKIAAEAPVTAVAAKTAPATKAAAPVAPAKTVAPVVPVTAAAPAPTAAAAPSKAPVAAAPSASIPDEAASAGTDQLVALARKALGEENAAGAEALARRALAKDADDHHAMEVLARSLIDQDRGPEAVTFARRIVDKRKKRVPYRLLLGDALLMVGDAAGARREWQAAAEIEPGNREVKQRLQ